MIKSLIKKALFVFAGLFIAVNPVIAGNGPISLGVTERADCVYGKSVGSVQWLYEQVDQLESSDFDIKFNLADLRELISLPDEPTSSDLNSLTSSEIKYFGKIIERELRKSNCVSVTVKKLHGDWRIMYTISAESVVAKLQAGNMHEPAGMLKLAKAALLKKGFFASHLSKIAAAVVVVVVGAISLFKRRNKETSKVPGVDLSRNGTLGFRSGRADPVLLPVSQSFHVTTPLSTYVDSRTLPYSNPRRAISELSAYRIGISYSSRLGAMGYRWADGSKRFPMADGRHMNFIMIPWMWREIEGHMSFSSKKDSMSGPGDYAWQSYIKPRIKSDLTHYSNVLLLPASYLLGQFGLAGSTDLPRVLRANRNHLAGKVRVIVANDTQTERLDDSQIRGFLIPAFNAEDIFVIDTLISEYSGSAGHRDRTGDIQDLIRWCGVDKPVDSSGKKAEVALPDFDVLRKQCPTGKLTDFNKWADLISQIEAAECPQDDTHSVRSAEERAAAKEVLGLFREAEELVPGFYDQGEDTEIRQAMQRTHERYDILRSRTRAVAIRPY